jgi:hypothetical protein
MIINTCLQILLAQIHPPEEAAEEWQVGTSIEAMDKDGSIFCDE